MISARLFRLYRLASPTANAAAKKIPEPTLRRVASTRPNVVAVDRSITLSWTRYCATSADKSGDATAAADATILAESGATPIEPDSAADAVRAAEEPASTDSPPAEAVSSDILPSSEPVADATILSETASPDPPPTSAESASAESADPAVATDPPNATVTETTPPPPPPPSTPTSTAAAGLSVHALTDRALIRVEGTDTKSLLQGLVTQDLELLNQSPSVYAMMLNLQGRVLYDIIIYNISSPRSETQKYLVECDATVAADVVSHLKKYKLRKNCDIVDISDVYEVSSVRPLTERMAGLSSLPRKSEFAEAFDPLLIACRDPRLKDIGWRLISGKGFEVYQAIGGAAVSGSLVQYREQRYKLGVAEGIHDLEPGKAFPLESNLVFLNGVSFSKGCYLGQELTARTHHTGVIRKRIMPLTLSTPSSSEYGPFPGNLILNTAGKDAGKFRDAVGVHGIGLVRVTMSGGRLIVVGKGRESECYARMPHWWPMDDPAVVLGEEEEEHVEEAAAGEKSAQNSS